MSLVEPKPGLVICYSYLWSHEAAKGREEGVKDRPCVIDRRGRSTYGQLGSDRDSAARHAQPTVARSTIDGILQHLGGGPGSLDKVKWIVGRS
jgi:hypothetical protein